MQTGMVISTITSQHQVISSSFVMVQPAKVRNKKVFITLSTAEAEYVAMAATAQELPTHHQ